MNEEQIFKKVLDCSFRVHSSIGPGLLESAYEECSFSSDIDLSPIIRSSVGIIGQFQCKLITKRNQESNKLVCVLCVKL